MDPCHTGFIRSHIRARDILDQIPDRAGEAADENLFVGRLGVGQDAGFAATVGESGSGHTAVMDGPEDLGGRNLGPRPMEMLLMGTGGCSIYDVMSMLKKSRQKVVDCRVEMAAERADEIPAVFTRINMHFVVNAVIT